MTLLRFRAADPDDAEKIALLHANSWRRHYRGAYADSFLDGDIVADRRSVWSSRLSVPATSVTVVADDGTTLVGFVHVVFDDDRWGSLIDNLHVTHNRQRTGIGTTLLTCAADAASERATGKSLYLWVLEQNSAAQQFYQRLGGTCIEKAIVSPPRRHTGPAQRLPQQTPLHLARRLIAGLPHWPVISRRRIGLRDAERAAHRSTRDAPSCRPRRLWSSA